MAGLQPFGKSVAADAVTTEQLASGEALGVGAGISTRTRQENVIGSDIASLHELAQLGDIAGFERLARDTAARDETLDVNERDQGDVTALHWAAINAHVGACEWLIDHGAEIDVQGGELRATPLQWAARNGHLYVMQLLLSRSANPDIQDAQGFNTLHLVTHSSAVMPLLYLLRQPIAVDAKDTDGHTALMWAAWQGDALSIDLLLKHGASVQARDAAQLTPLHWAAVKGSRPCISRLIDAGAELDVKEENGKTPAEMARELKAEEPWKSALLDAGLTETGQKSTRTLSKESETTMVWILPTIFFGCSFLALASLPVYSGIPLALGFFFLQHHVITKSLLGTRGFGDVVTKSPYFAAIIASSMVYVGGSWATLLLNGTPGHLTLNLVFIVSLSTCAYNFFKAVKMDPGWTRSDLNQEQLTELIEQLAADGILNGTHFCIVCMARKPLRAKHCRLCNRCTGRFDHHCPWIWNCVGYNNHPNFLLFVATLVIGIVSFVTLAVLYYRQNSPAYPTQPSPYVTFCQTLPAICGAYTHAPFLFGVTSWATLQLTWTIILLLSQIWQVTRQMTTLEVSNLGRYGFMGGRGGTSLREQGGAMANHMQTSHVGGQASSSATVEALGAGAGQSGAEEDGLTIPDAGSGLADSTTIGPRSGRTHPSHRRSHGFVGLVCGGLRRLCANGHLLQLLGLDRFTKGAAGRGMKLAQEQGGGNPFDMGAIANCADFWTRGQTLGVDYRALYVIPSEGFTRPRTSSSYAYLRALTRPGGPSNAHYRLARDLEPDNNAV